MSQIPEMQGGAEAAAPPFIDAAASSWRRALSFLASPAGGRLAWVFTLVPVILCGYYVYTYGVNVVWEDEWAMMPLFEKHDTGTLTLGDFWKQHNEHRHCIPKMVIFALASATRWNVVAELWFTQAMLLAMLAMLLSVFWRECASHYRAWLMVPVAFLAMGLRQSQNLLFGWQIGFVMIATSAVATLYCLYLMNRPGLRGLKFAGAIVAATVATCSGGSGPMVWIAGLVPLELLPIERRRKTILFVSWIILGIIEWIAYFWGYQKPAVHPDVQFSLLYGLAFAGGALFPPLFIVIPGAGMIQLPLVPMVVGFAIIVLALAAAILSFANRSARNYSFWLGIILYAFLVDGATTMGRAGFGPGQALSTRYATFAGLAAIGIYGILTCLDVTSRARHIAATWGFLFSLIVVGLAASTVEGFDIAAKEKLAKEYHQFVLSTIDTQPDEVARAANESADPIREGVVLLKKHLWNVYSPGGIASRYDPPPATLPVLAAPAQVVLDQFNVVKDKDYIVVSGWALNAERNDLVGEVYLDIDGTLYPTFYGVPRPDVAQALIKAGEKSAGDKESALPADVLQVLKDGRLDNCGFERAITRSIVPKGHHRLGVKVLTKDRKAFCAPQILGELNVE